MNELDVRYQLNRVQEDALRYGYTPILEYFNPDNNRLWKLFQEEGLELLRANRVGMMALPIFIMHSRTSYLIMLLNLRAWYLATTNKVCM